MDKLVPDVERLGTRPKRLSDQELQGELGPKQFQRHATSESNTEGDGLPVFDVDDAHMVAEQLTLVTTAQPSLPITGLEDDPTKAPLPTLVLSPSDTASIMERADSQRILNDEVDPGLPEPHGTGSFSSDDDHMPLSLRMCTLLIPSAEFVTSQSTFETAD